MPPLRGRVTARYDDGLFFGSVEGVFAADQDRVDSDLKEAPTPGYGVMNLRAGGQLKKVRVTVALDNVFNRLYVQHNSFQRDPYRTGVRVPEPGRNLYASVSYRF
jgi:iron complex outermembrane receptor protein